MVIGVLAAIPPERLALDEVMSHRTEVGAFTVGTIDGHQVCVGSTGIGKVNAAVAATQLFERFDPGTVVFTGVAGGLDPALAVGDVVIGTSLVQHDAGVLGDDGIETYQAGHIPFFNPTSRLGFGPSPRLEAAVRRAIGDPPMTLTDGGRIVFGTILTGDQFLASSQERERLHAGFSAQAIEMEGAAVAQVADRYGVDHLAIRTLSDLAGSGSPADFTGFLDRVARQTVEVLRLVLPVLSEMERL
ncbi:MAG TPA: 5'-methylthioadenosine/adenosylhomocysteine nucleosidase [Acidimicrobiia bacterium]|jgi:adenosylhomocysteine nucleosidase